MLKDIPSKKKSIIVDYLQNHDFVTVNNTTLLDELGCSAKTLERYLKVLYAQELLEIDTTRKSHQYRLKDKRYVVDELSEGDAFDLSLVLDSSGDETPQVMNTLKDIFLSLKT